MLHCCCFEFNAIYDSYVSPSFIPFSNEYKRTFRLKSSVKNIWVGQYLPVEFQTLR